MGANNSRVVGYPEERMIEKAIGGDKGKKSRKGYFANKEKVSQKQADPMGDLIQKADIQGVREWKWEWRQYEYRRL